MTSPGFATACTADASAVFTRWRAGAEVRGVSVCAWLEGTVAPPGPVPFATARFATWPAPMSAVVTAYVAVAVADWPGLSTREVPGHEYARAEIPVSWSVIPTFVSVTFPVFVTVKEYVTFSPERDGVDSAE